MKKITKTRLNKVIRTTIGTNKPDICTIKNEYTHF